ncbi:MAG TPA: chemotaxis protein CheW [Steroidobacteraceae bacterium]|nr:chemotaxis protein CheW [Steroidobacteraceae bacterium]
MQPEPTLRALRDRPFELLLALEKRARDVAAGAREGAAAQEWIGVAFRMGGETFLVERDEAREVMGVPSPITRVPGARQWIMGLANVRGQLLPVIDLKHYFGSGETVPGRNTRVIVVNHREIPAGLVVDEVLGFRRFAEREFNAESPPTLIRCEHYLSGSFRRGSEAWPVLSLRSLVESPAFLQGSA